MKKRNHWLIVGIIIVSSMIIGNMYTEAQVTEEGQLQLEIQAGNSCCIYGTSVVFGEKDINLGVTEFTGDFLSYNGTTSRGCKDLVGTETGWAMTLGMSGDMENENGNKIPAGNVRVSFDETTVIGGDCIPYNNSGTDVGLDTPVALVEKDGNIGTNYTKICELGTTNVKLKVVTEVGQAPGNYQGTIVITLPNFANAKCDSELIGTFYDAETDGLAYEGDQGSVGVTSDGGQFTYKPGEQITFKVGNVTLGNPVIPEVNGSVFVTDLFGLGRTEITDANVIKVGKLLQGLDADDNPDNGITIEGTTAGQITENENITTFDVETKLTALSKPVKTSKEVVQHLEDTAVNKLEESMDVNYSWIQTNTWSGTSDEYLLIQDRSRTGMIESYGSWTNIKGNVVDGSGNIYIVGEFEYPTAFGATDLTSSGNYDVYIAKLNNMGEWQWATKLGGTSDDYVGGITIDDSGNIYIVGEFQGTVDFGSTNLVSDGVTDVYVSKLNNAGEFQWTVKGGGTSSSRGRGISISQSGNIYIIGDFYQTVTFSGISLVSDGSDDVYIAKLNNIGERQRATKGGGYNNEHGNGITVDNAENVYIVGEFNSIDADFGATTFVSSGFYDIYVAKLNNIGERQWATKGGGTSTDNGNGIAVDNSGNVYIAGEIRLSVSFGSNNLSTTNNSYDILVAKLNNIGERQWATKGGGISTDDAKSISVDADGSIYVVGSINGTSVDFGSLSFEKERSGEDGYLGKLDNDGVWLSADLLNGLLPSKIGGDDNGNVYVVGSFEGNINYFNRVFESFSRQKAVIYKITPRDNENDVLYETIPVVSQS